MKEIAIIVPSFRRQHKIEECVQAWKDTTSGRSDFILVLEEKDEPYPEIDGITVIKGDYGSLSKAWNEGFKAFPDYQYYTFINDDHLIRTKGWEEKVISALKNGGVAYGNDLIQGQRLATAATFSGDIIRKLGVVSLPELEHLYIDNYWMEIGRGIGKLFYLPDLIIEHMHPAAGKAPMDAEYQKSNSNYDKEHKIFNHWLEHQKQVDIERLQ